MVRSVREAAAPRGPAHPRCGGRAASRPARGVARGMRRAPFSLSTANTYQRAGALVAGSEILL